MTCGFLRPGLTPIGENRRGAKKAELASLSIKK